MPRSLVSLSRHGGNHRRPPSRITEQDDDEDEDDEYVVAKTEDIMNSYGPLKGIQLWGS